MHFAIRILLLAIFRYALMARSHRLADRFAFFPNPVSPQARSTTMFDDPLFPLLLIMRYMHILGAIMLMGGTIFVRFALAPTAALLDAAARTDLHEKVRARWSKFVMLAAALLLISGLVNLALASRYEFGPPVGNKYHMIVGVKFLLGIPIFFIASFLAGRSATAKKFQEKATFWMNVNLALALIMVLIGGFLKFVPREPEKADPQAAAASERPVNSQFVTFHSSDS
jgi:uncharacterized membrane protein